MSAPTLRQALRSQTRESHQRLDTLVQQIRPFESYPGYQIYLVAMYRLLTQFSPAMQWTSHQAGLDHHVTVLQDCLVADEQLTLQASTDDPSVDPRTAISNSGRSLLPNTSAQIPLETAAQKWGAAYVIEGSAMGAQHLVRSIKSAPGDPLPCSFLETLAAGGGQRWPAFIAALDAFDGSHPETVEAAMRTFDAANHIFVATRTELQPGSMQSGQ